MGTSRDLSDPTPGRAHLVDWRGVGYLVTVVTERITSPVEGMHRAILARWFGMAGAKVEPARRVVDGLTASIYQTIRLGGTAVGTAITVGAELFGEHTGLRPIWETPNGRYVQSTLNALWGDKFDDDESPLRIELGLRDLDGSLIPTTPASLSRAFPEPTGRLVVMLHGLGETERCWRAGDNSSLTEGLEADGFSLLPVRYNTGRAVSDNGSDLADLIEEARQAWPVAVEDIALIGHSMGGLVARSAVGAARTSRHGWVDLTGQIVAIGTPHLGTPIEKAVHAVSDGLGLFAESRPLSVFLDQRSTGIKNLGAGVDDADNSTHAIRYHVVAGAVTTEPSHPLGVLVGDLVVRVGSATGKGRRLQVDSSEMLVVGGQDHGGLIHDPRVTTQTRRWLQRTS